MSFAVYVKLFMVFKAILFTTVDGRLDAARRSEFVRNNRSSAEKRHGTPCEEFRLRVLLGREVAGAESKREVTHFRSLLYRRLKLCGMRPERSCVTRPNGTGSVLRAGAPCDGETGGEKRRKRFWTKRSGW